jgi:hypothetical protein
VGLQPVHADPLLAASDLDEEKLVARGDDSIRAGIRRHKRRSTSSSLHIH